MLEEELGALELEEEGWLEELLLDGVTEDEDDELVHCGLPARPASAQSSGQLSARL